MDDDDIDEARLDLPSLRDEAARLGLVYSGNSATELHGLLSIAYAKQGTAPVRCFGLSYEPTDPRCRCCDLRNPCADVDKRPRVQVVHVQRQFLTPIPCDSCGTGVLNHELLDPENRTVRDYGCSTLGCHNTVSIQCGFQSATAAVPITEVHLGEAPVDAPELAVPGAGLVVVRNTGVGKKAAKPPEAPKAAVPKPHAKSSKGKGKPVAPGKRLDIRFRYRDEWYANIADVMFKITKAKGWSSSNLFGVAVRDVAPGQVLTCDRNGEEHLVEVHASE